MPLHILSEEHLTKSVHPRGACIEKHWWMTQTLLWVKAVEVTRGLHPEQWANRSMGDIIARVVTVCTCLQTRSLQTGQPASATTAALMHKTK